MKEIVIISGKGGTGKTTLCASFAAIASETQSAVFSDCDVDAADLHLLLTPKVVRREEFISGREAGIIKEKCIACGKCAEVCRFDAVLHKAGAVCEIDSASCEGCGVCVHFCPAKAIAYSERRCGEWYISDTRFGPLVHAQLDSMAENSGKLVTVVRNEARKIAIERSADLIITDGPPGTGCPVIASITGADAIVAISEPTLSAKHDLERIIELARHFMVPVYVCVNKCDINTQISDDIKDLCRINQIEYLGGISYDRSFTAAQIHGKSLIEFSRNSAATEIRKIWQKVLERINTNIS